MWFWGDPHIRTPDGSAFTFNGLGEYILIRVDDASGNRIFELQCRTQQAFNNDTNESAGATFYSGFAMEYVDIARVSVICLSVATECARFQVIDLNCRSTSELSSP